MVSAVANQFLGKADAAIIADNSARVNGQNYYSWVAQVQYNKWSRVLQVEQSSVVGGSYIITIQATRGNVVVNKTVLISYSHNFTFAISQLNGGDYSTIKVRGVVGSNGQGYLEILDANASFSGNQGYNITTHMLQPGLTMTPFTTFQDGTTIPSGYNSRGETTLINGSINAGSLQGYTPSSFARLGVSNDFGNSTNTMSKIKARHIDGLATDGASYDSLYVNYYANKQIKLGLNGAYYITSDGAQYSGNSFTATRLQTARTITVNGNSAGSVSFDGSANVTLNLTNHYADGAGTAVQLTNARTIFGQSFNGTANVAGQGQFYGAYNATASTRYATSALEIRECGLVGAAQSDAAYAPRIGFHWSGRYAGTLAFYNSEFRFVNQADAGYLNVRANIFYGSLSGNASSATNSSQLGGLAASGWQKKLAGAIADFNSTDAMTQGEWNFGSGSTIPNAPYTGAIYGKLVTIINDGGTQNNSSNWLWQIVYTTGGGVYYRNKTNNGGFTAWREFAQSNGTYSGMTVGTSTNSTQLGGVAAANYINTGDTLILRGTV